MSADLLAAFGNTQEQGTANESSLSPSVAKNNDANSGLLFDVDVQAPSLPPLQIPQAERAPEQPLWRKDAEGADVLFDATEDAPDDDDFGEFEAPESEVAREEAMQSKPAVLTDAPKPNVDLLDLDEDPTDPMEESLPAEQVPGEIFSSRTSSGLSKQNKTLKISDKDWKDPSQSTAVRDGPIAANTQHPASAIPSKKLGFGQVRRTNASDALGEDWGEFSEAPAGPQATVPANNHETPSLVDPEPPGEGWEPFERPNEPLKPVSTNSHPSITNTSPTTFQPPTSSPPQEIRPTNIPPPTILLSLIPSIFTSLRGSLSSLPSSPPTPFPPNNNDNDNDNDNHSVQSPPAPQSPALVELASSISLSHATASRLIAGRSLRWKRDTHLSQSVKIGPSISTKSGSTTGGMKLASLDRSEGLKESREVAEVVASWRTCAYRFNAFVKKIEIEIGTGMGTRTRKKPPTMAMAMIKDDLNLKVRVAKGGGMTAQHACALCGLRREERVALIDGDGDGDGDGGAGAGGEGKGHGDVSLRDALGEWWVEYWGHRECREWWGRYRGMLLER